MTHSIEAERDKYQRMWREPRYRTHSPGLNLVSRFYNYALSNGLEPTDSLIDLGCGTGRAGKALALQGFNVTLFDLVDAVDSGNGLPFIAGCLWELPESPKYQWIYCTDVLEHIPRDHVAATLKGMAAITGKGGLLQIAHFQDGCGQLIGETLHLTVKPPEWWQEKINKLWTVNKWDVEGSYSIVMLGRSFPNG